MHNPGTMALVDSSRVDFARLRRERVARCLAEMERAGIDVLLLGRESNVRYTSGARRLSLAGTRPFSPFSVVVAATESVHLLSTWDEGIPPEVPHERLFGLSWNPLNIVANVAAIPGMREARRVGVDSLSPLFEQLLSATFPSAELVDGEAVLRAARTTKTADELACIRTAVALAEACLASTVRVLRPGVSERTLLGAFEARMVELGVTTPAREGTFCATPRWANGHRPPLRQVAADGAVDEGDLVAISSGVMYAGYEGSVGRTFACARAGGRPRPDQRALHRRWRELWDAVAAACRPGATGDQVRKAYEATGEPLPPVPIVRGMGLGYESPVIGTHLGAEADAAWTLLPGMTLLVSAYAWAEGVGGYLGQEAVLVTDDGLEVLTRASHGPLADDEGSPA